VAVTVPVQTPVTVSRLRLRVKHENSEAINCDAESVADVVRYDADAVSDVVNCGLGNCELIMVKCDPSPAVQIVHGDANVSVTGQTAVDIGEIEPGVKCDLDSASDVVTFDSSTATDVVNCDADNAIDVVNVSQILP
jgi:hypothetical protein